MRRGCALRTCWDGAVDDGLDEVVFVGEVVVEPPLADVSRFAHVIESRAGDSVLEHECGGRTEDAVAGCRPLLVTGSVVVMPAPKGLWTSGPNMRRPETLAAVDAAGRYSSG